MRRELVSEDQITRVFNVYDDEDRLVGTDIEQIPTSEELNERTLQQAAVQALQSNKDYLGRSNPTNAQVVAQVRSLTQQTNGLIRLLLKKLDGTD